LGFRVHHCEVKIMLRRASSFIVMLGLAIAAHAQTVTVTFDHTTCTPSASWTATPRWVEIPPSATATITPVAQSGTSYGGYTLNVGVGEIIALNVMNTGAYAGGNATTGGGYEIYDVTYAGTGPTGWPGTDGYAAWATFPNAVFSETSGIAGGVSGASTSSVTITSLTAMSFAYPPDTQRMTRSCSNVSVPFWANVLLTYHSATNHWTGQMTVPVDYVTVSGSTTNAQGAVFPSSGVTGTFNFGHTIAWGQSTGSLVGPLGTIVYG
jgi:hypothetical protein